MQAAELPGHRDGVHAGNGTGNHTGDTSAALVLTGSSCQPALLGGKGAALDRLIAWGLPVPPTAVVTAATYRRVVAAPGPAALLARLGRRSASAAVVSAEEVDEVFLSAPFADELADQVVAAAAAVARAAGTNRLAVRSSATVEDLAHSSFAGQYRSFLAIDATDRAELLRAVRLVFASLWHPAPCAYRRAFGIDDGTRSGGTQPGDTQPGDTQPGDTQPGDTRSGGGGGGVAMAAVLMAMVPARRAGVVFTVDPGRGAGVARVEVVEGLAESLVSGQETPTALLLPRDGAASDLPAPDSPDPDADVDPEVREALRLALRVEDLAGCPQDIEWAWDGERVWLVQARPITVLTDDHGGDELDDSPEALDGLDLTTASIGEMLPGVLPPLVWDVSSFLVEEAFRSVLDGLGALPEGAAERRWLIRRIRGRAAMDFGQLAALSSALPGANPEHLEQQYFGSRRPGRAAAPGGGRRHNRWRSAVHDTRVMATRRRASFDGELVIRAAEHLAREHAATADTLDALTDAALLARHLRVLDLAARAMAAELGVAADAAASYRRLELHLARWLGLEEAGRLAERATSGRGALVAPAPDASAAVIGGPTWQELRREPPTPRQPVPDGAATPAASPRRPPAELIAALEAVPGWPSGSWRARLRLRTAGRLAYTAAEQLVRRERTKAAVLRLGGELRRLHLLCGTRLVAEGLLDQVEDVDLLTVAELRSAVAGAAHVTPEAIARRRRWQQRHRDDGPLPARFCGWPASSTPALPAGDRLEGWAASGGRFTGTAVLLRQADDPLPHNAVLVAEATDPSWSPLFVRAGAIVLERGGPLSHAAILARELGVPAVLNVAGATALAGRRVTVDGDHGVVFVTDDLPPLDEEAVPT